MSSNGPKKSHFTREVQGFWKGVSNQGLDLHGPIEAQIQKALHQQRKTSWLGNDSQGQQTGLANSRKVAPGKTVKEWQPQHNQ